MRRGGTRCSNIGPADGLGKAWAAASRPRIEKIRLPNGAGALDFSCRGKPRRNSLRARGPAAIGPHKMSRRGNTMPISRRTLLTTLAATPFASLLPRPAFAAYPDKPIRLIVPFAAGGNADLVARLVAEGMSPSLGQTDRRRVARRRRRQPRRCGGRDLAAGRLHAAHRLERPADRQSVRAGQAQLRSAEGFRRHRARQPRAALDRAAQLGAGEDRWPNWSRCRRSSRSRSAPPASAAPRT